ncbi:MAG: ribosome biogenesis GTPase Der [Rickettsiales bacterium]|jgi:GTP-binding protein|nr:ribosome biogenesis GTPase Der [Rickettsiales bacterium]
MRAAIVGRPNVGKSSLFNALTKTRDALVHDRPGVTRDVVEGGRGGVTFLDTAGLESAGGGISKDATDFAVAAARGADAVLFVVDARAGLVPMDIEWARMIKRDKRQETRDKEKEARYKGPETRDKRFILIANKCESKKGMDNLHEFHKLGLGEPLPVSAEHNIGLGDIMRRLDEMRGPESGAEDSPAEPPKISIAIMGRPNVGKSTLTNRILGARRVLVRDEPGITRDTIRVRARRLGREIELVDTAGLRKKSSVKDDIETLAALKALDAIANVDAAILVLDATEDIDRQSVRIAERIFDAGRILCVALNKWDLVKDKDERLPRIRRAFSGGFSQIMKPLVVPISAETGAGVENMMRRIYALSDIADARAPTSLVNRTVEKLVAEKHPPMSRLKRPMKIKFAAHTGTRPHTVTINVGGASDIPESYTRYLRRGIATRLGWESLPVVIKYSKEENPFRG